MYGCGGHVNGFGGTGFLDHAREVCFPLCEGRYAFLIVAEMKFDGFHMFCGYEYLRTFCVASVVSVALKVIAVCIL